MEAVLYDHDLMNRHEEMGRCKLPIKVSFRDYK